LNGSVSGLLLRMEDMYADYFFRSTQECCVTPVSSRGSHKIEQGIGFGA